LKRMPSFAYSIARLRITAFKSPFVIIETEAFYAGDWLIYKRRCDAHNVPRFLFQHLFHRELGDVEESQQVGRDQGIEILGSKVRERLGAEDSGIIHQNIDGSEVLDRSFDSFGDGLLLADIAVDQH